MTPRYGSLVDHLIDLRRDGYGFEAAWAIAAGRKPTGGEDGGTALFRYNAFRQAYAGGGKPCKLTRDSASDPEFTGSPRRGASRPSKLVA